MPCAGKYLTLALRTIDGEIFRGKMVRVCGSDRHNHMTGADVQLRQECLLYPELLKGDLTAALDIFLVLSHFLLFELHCAFHASMLELNLRTHAPALAEVETDHENDMRQVETAMTLGVLIVGCMAVTVHVVGIEIVGIGHLTIAAELQAREE
jgi:hypothetical protein